MPKETKYIYGRKRTRPKVTPDSTGPTETKMAIALLMSCHSLCTKVLHIELDVDIHAICKDPFAMVNRQNLLQ